MPEDIQSLLEKIHREGVKAAEEKARQIEEEANHKAADVLAAAREEAARIVAAAEAEGARFTERGEAAVAQAGRNLLLTLRNEIAATLERLVRSQVHAAMTPEALARIIEGLLARAGAEGEVVLSLREEDRAKLEQGFLAGLRDELKKGIVLKSSEDIQGGFTISYDAGRSHYDFSDAALAEHLCSHLRPPLNDLLKAAAGAARKDHAQG